MLKMMVVAPGSTYSTFDTYIYYLDAFQKILGEDNVYGFAFQNVIHYHTLAREGYFEKYAISLGDEVSDIIRASREFILEVILRKPDVLFFIDGSKFPLPMFYELSDVIKELNRNIIVAGYVTEAPYIDKVIDRYAKFIDVLFTNELSDVKRRDPEDNRHVHYLPHSYAPVVHYPAEVTDKYHRDVFFCGTVFPERAEILSGVDWTGIDALLCGSWILSHEKFELMESKFPGIAVNSGLLNSEVAEYYRGSKICINLDRTYGWDNTLEEQHIIKGSAYSVGPRIIEAAACGAFILSEPRPELIALFGDSIPTFTNAKELEDLIRYYLNHEEERAQKAKECLEIVQDMNYETRANYVVQILSQVHDFLNGGKDG